jgi:hypothetical protein
MTGSGAGICVEDKMAVTSDTLQIVIKLRDQASRGIKGIGRTLNAVTARVKKTAGAFTGLKATILGLVGTAAVGLMARSFIKAADTAEGYRVRLSVLLGTQKEANALFKDMAEFAGGVSFQYEEIMESATGLAGVLEGGRKEVSQWMPVLSDLAAASGLTMQETTSNFIRMYSSGAAAADQFRDRGILAMLGFQAKTAYTAEQTRKMLMKAWEDPASKFRDAATKLANTWGGLMSMMADRWFQFRVKVMEEGGLLDYMKGFVKTILNMSDELDKAGGLEDWAVKTSEAVINGFETILLGAAGFYDALAPIMREIGVILGSIWDFWKDMPTWMQEIGLVAGIMGGKKGVVVVAGLSHLANALKNTARGIELVKKGELDFGDFADMGYEELDNFLKEYDAKIKTLTKDAGEALDVGGEEIAGSLRARVQKFLDEVRAQQAKFKKLREGVGEEEKAPTIAPPKIDTKMLKAQLSAETKLALEENKTMMAALEADWAQHNIKIKEYFQQRLDLLNSSYELQRAAIEKQIALEEDPAKKTALKAQLAILEQQHIRTLIGLQMDLTAATEDEVQARKDAASVIEQINNRLAASKAEGGGLAEQFAMEQEALRQQQQADIDALLELKKKGLVVEAEMADAHRKHQLEQEQLSANQRKQVWETYVGAIQGTLSSMTSMFNDWYQAAGSKNKELFTLYKAAAIAETIISTYSAAQKAYESMAKIHPALAASAAAIAVAAGLARVQLIRQQQMATGGLVGGVSPTPTADNIPIRATAGEYMHPVSTVKHYGVKAMEAIRKKLVPRELLLQFASRVPTIKLPTTAEYATGGPVSAMAAGAAGDTNLSMTVPINLPEQLGFIGRRLEAEIEPVILRVLQEELSY